MDPPKITRPPVPADRAERSRRRRVTWAGRGGCRPGWVPSLAAAAAVAAVVAGTVGVSSALDRPGVTRPAGPARQAIAYVVNDTSPGTVTPVRTATNTALAPIKVGGGPWTIAITPDGRTAYVASLASATVTPVRTATNTALAPVTVGHSAHYAIAITPDGGPPTWPAPRLTWAGGR
jgi:YVTN family beta-propeller protein